MPSTVVFITSVTSFIGFIINVATTIKKWKCQVLSIVLGESSLRGEERFS